MIVSSFLLSDEFPTLSLPYHYKDKIDPNLPLMLINEREGEEKKAKLNSV